MGSSTISLGLGLGGGKAATSSGRPAGGGAFSNEYSISLDGTDDFISIPASTDFDLGTGAFTYSMWFNLSDFGPIAGGGQYGGLIYRA